MNKLNTIVSGIILSSAMISGASFAANDGTAGPTSSGDSLVSLTINDRVQITSITDIALGAYGGTGDLTGETEFCVYRNGGDDYQLTLTSDTTGFWVKSTTTTDTIDFVAKVDDSLDASSGEVMAQGAASGVALTGANSLNCGGVDNAAMYVSLLEADLQAAPTSVYQATVTMLVEPI